MLSSVVSRAQLAASSWPLWWISARFSRMISAAVNKQDFDYIKIGPFIKHLGPLKKPTTNQRLYRKDENGQFEDITSRLWKK